MAVAEVHIGANFGVESSELDQVSTAMEAQVHVFSLTFALALHFHECEYDPSERTYILSQCAASIVSLARFIRLFDGSTRLIKPIIQVEVDDNTGFYSIECISERLSHTTTLLKVVASGKKNVPVVDEDTKRDYVTIFLNLIKDTCTVAAKLGVNDLTPYIEEWC